MGSSVGGSRRSGVGCGRTFLELRDVVLKGEGYGPNVMGREHARKE